MLGGKMMTNNVRRKSTIAAALLASAGLAIVLTATTANAKNPVSSLVGAKVDNFLLSDQRGVGHELYYYKNAPAVVIVSHQLGDQPASRAIEALQRLQTAYESKGVVFMALNSSRNDDHASIRSQAKAINVPVLDDELQLVGRSLGVTTTAEAFVISPRTWTVLYHGPIDDSFAQKKGANANLASALDAMIAGRTAPVTEAKVKGTKIDFPDRKKTAEFKKISYANDVAPILARNCVACHTTGGIAPFAMDRYETVKGFAPMIRESLRTKRMPPYHADPHYGSFKGDMNLAPEEILTVVNWVEAGAPRGSGEDPLARVKVEVPEWPLGEPDLVLDLPSFDVPASGIVDYIDLKVKNPLSEGKYIQAMTYRPGAVETVHHIIGTWRADGAAPGEMRSANTGGYGPGSESKRYPQDTGAYVPPGGTYNFQMHYTTTGKAATDITKVGLYFTKSPPKNILRQLGVMDYSIEIPAGEGRHHERSYVEFPESVKLYGVRPHAHYRGYSTKLTMRYPDGTEKILHSQPRYDFSWQREYTFDQLIDVPKGSILIADYVFDNSVDNPWNPDPKHNVTFGEQTMDEMLFTYVYYYIDGETRENPRDDVQRQIQTSISFSALDDNIDGKMQLAEVRGARMAAVRTNFSRLDKNGDGGLDKAEFPLGNSARALAQLADGNLTALDK